MKLHLRVVSGLHVGDQGRIEPPGGMIGRAEGCALHLRDDSVSRSHMELRFQQDSWWAVQRSARSPSLVDGALVGCSPKALRDSGVLQVGSVTIEYSSERTAAVREMPESPPTTINVRRHLSTIQSSLLPKMTPLRAVEPPPSEMPQTLILRRQPTVSASEPQQIDASPTLISRAAPLTVSPLVRDPPTTEPPLADALRQVETEREKLRAERDQLAEKLIQISRELSTLRDNAVHPVASSAPSNLAAQALLLLTPFGNNLEQASSALQDGDAARARTLLREASFGLADLRDLFESVGF